MDFRKFVTKLGSADILYSEEAKKTYFKQVYTQDSHFSEQIMTLQFPKNYFYGDEVTLELYRNGDIIQGAYLYTTFSNSGVACVDSAGTYMIDYAQLEYEEEVIERLDGEFIEVHNDIQVPKGKQIALGPLTGKGFSTLNANYGIKLNFDIFETGFPVCALKKNPLIRIKFRTPTEFIPTYTGSLALNAKLLVNYAFLPKAQRDYFMKTPLLYLIEQSHRTNFYVRASEIVSANKTNSVSLTSTSTISASSGTFNFTLTIPNDYSTRLTSNITLGLAVSDAVPVVSNYDMYLNGSLVSTTKTSGTNVVNLVYTGALTGGTTYTVGLVWSGSTVNTATCTFSGNYYTTEAQPITVFTDFSHPVKELFFVIQSDGTSPYNYTLGGLDQFYTIRMVLNGYEVIPTNLGTASFLRILQGLENHTRCPDRYFYMYPFALDPENRNPTGSANFNALVRQQFDFAFRKTSPEVGRSVRIYARVHNLMEIKDGNLSILYDRKDADAVRN